MYIKLATTLFLIFKLFNFVFSFSIIHYNTSNYPNPNTVQGKIDCNANETSSLCDPDKLLSSEKRQAIAKLIEKFEKNTRSVRILKYYIKI